MRFRAPIYELEALIPAFRRTDSDRWAKWKFYPGALTVLLPRFLFGVVLGILLNFYLLFSLCGHSWDEPLVGARRVIVRCGYTFFCFLFNIVTNFNLVTWHRLSLTDVNNYEEWLGPIQEQEK